MGEGSKGDGGGGVGQKGHFLNLLISFFVPIENKREIKMERLR